MSRAQGPFEPAARGSTSGHSSATAKPSDGRCNTAGARRGGDVPEVAVKSVAGLRQILTAVASWSPRTQRLTSLQTDRPARLLTHVRIIRELTGPPFDNSRTEVFLSVAPSKRRGGAGAPRSNGAAPERVRGDADDRRSRCGKGRPCRADHPGLGGRPSVTRAV